MQKVDKDKTNIHRVIKEKQPELTNWFTIRRIHTLLCKRDKSGGA